jgi:GT2 family glycosyltransferase
MIVYSIVVTYNGIRWVDRCFGSLVCSEFKTKILAIDNASTDGTPERIHLKFPEVEVIEMSNNLGFGQANNIGLRLASEAKADYVFLLNQDAWIQPETIKLLIQTQQNNPEYWILSPIQMNGLQKEVELGFKAYLNKNKCNLESVVVQEVDFINAAMWLLPIQCVETVGGFDPLFPHYGEDNDYVQRVHYRNKKVGAYLKAIGYHDRQMVTDKAIFRNSYRVRLIILSQLKNITHPMAYNISYSMYNFLRKLIKYSTKMDFISLLTYWRALFSALKQLKSVNSQRKKTLKPNAFLVKDVI